MLSSKTGNNERVSPPAIFIHHSSGHCSQSNKARKGNKMCKYPKGRIKLSLFKDDMMVYIENPKESTKNFPELTSERRKFDP